MQDLELIAKICWILAGTFAGLSIVLWSTLKVGTWMRRHSRKYKRISRKEKTRKRKYGLHLALFMMAAIGVCAGKRVEAAMITPYPVSSFGSGSGGQAQTDTNGESKDSQNTAGRANGESKENQNATERREEEGARFITPTPMPIRETDHTSERKTETGGGSAGRTERGAAGGTGEKDAGVTGGGTAGRAGEAKKENDNQHAGDAEGSADADRDETARQRKMLEENQKRVEAQRQREQQEKEKILQRQERQRENFLTRRERILSETVVYGVTADEVLTRPVEISVFSAPEEKEYFRCTKSVTCYAYKKREGRITALQEEIPEKIVSGRESRFQISADGQYTLRVSYTFSGGLERDRTWHFTVNRDGSVYEAGSELTRLQGKWAAELPEVLTMEEYNPCPLQGKEIITELTKDGVRMVGAVCCEREQMENGWWRCLHRVQTGSVSDEGMVELQFTSRDTAGNYSESEKYMFHVDAQEPELLSMAVSPKDEDSFHVLRMRKDPVRVAAVIFDASGLSCVRVYLNGELYETYMYPQGQQTCSRAELLIRIERKDRRRGRIKLEIIDRAGNITMTENKKILQN